IGRSHQSIWGVSADGLALVRWEHDRQEHTEEVARAATTITNGALAENGQRLCFTRASGELCTLELDGSGTIHTAAAKHEYLWSLTLDREARRLWTVNNHRRVECRSIPDGTIIWSTPAPAVTTDLRSIPHSQTLAVALENGDIQIHDASTGALLRAIPSGSSAIQSIVATSDGRRLVGGGIEGDLHVIDIESGTYLASIAVGAVGPIHNVRIADTTGSIAVLGKSGLLRMVRTQ
ncbi:MAG: hypothetical protein ACREF9_19265, partial [Opitutaceae bacterium]